MTKKGTTMSTNNPYAVDEIAPGVNLVPQSSADEIREKIYRDVAKAAKMYGQLENGFYHKSVHKRIQAYQFICRTLFDYFETHDELRSSMREELEQERGKRGRNAGKRWTPEQDDALVAYVCSDAEEATSTQAIANAFGRTPAAITSRLSHLVGIKKISYEVVAHIDGYLDGTRVSGHFEGTVRTESDLSALEKQTKQNQSIARSVSDSVAGAALRSA